MNETPVSCPWSLADPLMRSYHDAEWGVPVHNDRRHFEMLVLEGAQAGLSWLTVLRRREGYRRAFAGFDPEAVAVFSQQRLEELLLDPGLIRNRAKITATIRNARRFLEVQQEFGSFDRYIWGFVGGRPIDHRLRRPEEIPATTPESDDLSRDLKKRGFGFVGSTICYAHMQAAGLCNDHLVSCHRYSIVQALA